MSAPGTGSGKLAPVQRRRELVAVVLVVLVALALTSGLGQALAVEGSRWASEPLRQRAVLAAQGASPFYGLLLVAAVLLVGDADGRRARTARAAAAVLGVIVVLAALGAAATELTAPRLAVSPQASYRLGALGFRLVAVVLGALAAGLATAGRPANRPS